MLRVRVYEGGKLVEGGEELLASPGTVWIDCEAPDEATLLELGERFGLHKLAIEDCLHLDQRPKLEDYPGHEFVVLQGFTLASDDPSEITLHELHFFIGDSWLISVHSQAHDAIDSVVRRLLADAEHTIGRGPDFVAYMLADALVDSNFPMLDRLNDALESLEERIFESPNQALMQEAFELKRTLVTLRRVLSPQRDVVGLLSRRGVPHIQEKNTLFFRDVYDHLVRVYEQLEAARDLVGNVMEVYLAVLANRTNDVTKQLTIFASIFMPLSFIAGFFGQNFEGIARPEFLGPMLATMVLLPASMLYWFHRKGWL